MPPCDPSSHIAGVKQNSKNGLEEKVNEKRRLFGGEEEGSLLETGLHNGTNSSSGNCRQRHPRPL